MSSVPREAAIGFQRAAADYERGRPGYPAEAIAILARGLDLGPGRRVVDLAAGTGKLTRALVGLGAELYAVEPVAGMRAQLRRAVPGVPALDGTAERMPFDDAGVDAVVVAQAFHWFDVPAAAVEIHRVLAPGGGLGVVRNEWDDSTGWVGELRALMSEHARHRPRDRARRWRRALDGTGLFTPLVERIVPNQLSVDSETLVARVASTSYVALMEAGDRASLLDAVRRLVRDRGVTGPDGLIATPYLTHVLWCHRHT